MLYRYANDQDRHYFEQLFGDAFAVVYCDSDALALSALQANEQSFDALFVEFTCLPDVLNSPVLAVANQQLPHAQKILLNADVSLDGVIQLLDAHSLTKCFAQPYDANLIKSTVFAAQMRIQEPIRARPDEGVAGSRPTVLIVDDETDATKYLKKNLQRLGAPFDILCAADAADALGLLEQHAASVAVIMSDHKMPGMQGNQLLNQIRNVQPNVVRILTSAYGEVDVALNAINEGSIFQYIKKPWDSEQVLVCLNAALHKHTLLLEKSRQAQLEIDQHHQLIIGSRIQAVTSALGHAVDDVAGQGTLATFLACLARIEVSSSYASAIRASNSAIFELDLVDALSRVITPQLEAIQRHKKTQTHADCAKHFIAYVHGQAPEPLAAYLHEQLYGSLGVLLSASGIEVAALTVVSTATSFSITPPGELKIYSHLLGPLKKISPQFIQHQAALLMLFVIAHVLEADLTLGCDKQSLTMRFACAQTSER